MRPATLPRLAVGLLACIAIGCGAPGPSASTSAASPGAPVATAVATELPDLTPAPSPTPVPLPTTGAEDGIFRIVLRDIDGDRELPVVVQDLTGLVVGIEATPQGEPPFDKRVSNPAGQPNVLRYQWTGGACDTLTSITFERVDGGYRVTGVTKSTGDICILIGIFRGVDIQLSEPVDADSVIVGDR